MYLPRNHIFPLKKNRYLYICFLSLKIQVNLLGYYYTYPRPGVITLKSTYRGKKDKGLEREENHSEWWTLQ